MKVTLESTSKVVTVGVNGADVPARIWQGQTESGVPVHCYITRIVPEIAKTNPRIDELTAEFEHELERCADPRRTVEAIPLRMIL